MQIEEKEMKSVNGGAISFGIIAGACAGIVYLIGVLSGYTNPDKCNNRKR